MALTEEQQQAVIRHLTRKEIQTKCRMCGKGELKVNPELSGTPLIEKQEKNLIINAREIIPYVQIVCPDCWHVEHFMAEGIFGNLFT